MSYAQIKTLLKECTAEQLEKLSFCIDQLLEEIPKSREEILLSAAEHYVFCRRGHQAPKYKTLELDLQPKELVEIFEEYLLTRTLKSINDVPSMEIMACEVELREKEWLHAQKEGRVPNYENLVRELKYVSNYV